MKSYKTIWSYIEDLKNIDLDASPVYDDRYIKTKIRTYSNNVYTNFRGLNAPEDVEAVAQRWSVKKVFLEISQSSQENTCITVPFLKKLQASGKGIDVAKSNNSKECLSVTIAFLIMGLNFKILFVMAVMIGCLFVMAVMSCLNISDIVITVSLYYSWH